VYIIRRSTNSCITPVEGVNAYLQKYAYKYTYICIFDSLSISNFGNPLEFVEISYYRRFIAHPITKIMFHSLILMLPIAVAARAKSRTVFALSNTEIGGSNPTRGMDVCVFSVCVYSVSTPCGGG
jgi:hypothetical protein